MDIRNEALYGWLITFNCYENEWLATRNDNMFALFNGTNDKVLRVKGVGNINTVLDLINRTQGNPEKLKELVHEG